MPFSLYPRDEPRANLKIFPVKDMNQERNEFLYANLTGSFCALVLVQDEEPSLRHIIITTCSKRYLYHYYNKFHTI